MKTTDQLVLKMYVRTRMDFQSMRKQMDNRLGLKADGTPQKIKDNRTFGKDDLDNFQRISTNARKQEKEIQSMLGKVLKKFPIYKGWLKDVKGVGDIAAGWLLSEFDIAEATTVSKMWQYAGMNPSLVRGKKRVNKENYKPEMGRIVSEVENIKTESVDYIVETNIMIRGDRPCEGFVLPYNKNLRTYLLGVMAPGFIKAQNDYAIEFYYPYKSRLENEQRPVQNEGKPRKDDGKAWNEVSKGHRDNAAKRYMVKMFLKDFYCAWRGVEGLPVRPSYAEEYLEKVHAI